MDVVFAHADRIIVLARGELIAEGTPAAVRDDPRCARSISARAPRSRPRRKRHERAMLHVEALDAWYGQAQILYGVRWRGRGRMRRAGGRNGAGKSTTMKAIMGLMARRRGRVAFRGRDISALPAYRIGRLGLGWVPEDRRIFTDLTVRENLVSAASRRARARRLDAGRLFALFPNLGGIRRPGGR